MRTDEEHILRKVLGMDAPGKKEERMTENKMERRMPTRLEKYCAESGRGRCGEGRSSVIPATLHDGKSQGKRSS